MSFPLDALDMHVEALIDGAWNDLGSGPGPLGPDIRVVAEPIPMSRGRQDEASRVSPGQWQVTLWNDDGLLSPIPASDWWRGDGTGWDFGTEMRVRVGSTVLSHGEISDIAVVFPEGDISGDDDMGISFVEVTVSGILRRLGQRRKPLRSCLYRCIASAANLPHVYDYFPMEEGSDGSELASGIPNENRTWMTYDGELDLGSDATLEGSEPLPVVPEGKSAHWYAKVNGFSGHGVVEGFFRFPERPVDVSTVVRIIDVYGTGSIARFNVEVVNMRGIPLMWVRAFDADGIITDQSLVPLLHSTVFFTPNPMQFRLTMSEAGGSTTWHLAWWTTTRGVDPGEGVGDTWSGTFGQVYAVGGGVGLSPPKGFTIGHLILHDGIGAGWLVGVDVGKFGESTRGRINRLTIEEGIPCVFVGGSDTRSMPLGPQRPIPLPDLLDEAQAADRGILYEDPRALRLKYLHLRARYNREPSLTLNAANSEIANPFRPVRDDQTIRNDVTGQRLGGISVRRKNEPSIAKFGLYDEQLTVNVVSDLIVRHVTGWQLRLGDDHGLRVAQLTIDLAIAPHLIPAWGAMEPGKVIRVINLPPQLGGAMDLILQGDTQAPESYAWPVVANCTSAKPFTVAKWGDPWDGPLPLGL